MRIDAAKVHLTAHDVKIVGGPPLLELRIDGADVIVTDSKDGKLWVRSATGTIVVTESAINEAIASTAIDKVRDLDLKTYNGFVRVSGRYQVLGAVSTNFTVTAAPELESGIRLQLAVRDFSVAGSVPMPAFVVNMVAARINEQLGQAFDMTRLPVPIRLTGVTVEPGRMTLSAKLEMPPESAPGATTPEMLQ